MVEHQNGKIGHNNGTTSTLACTKIILFQEYNVSDDDEDDFDSALYYKHLSKKIEKVRFIIKVMSHKL